MNSPMNASIAGSPYLMVMNGQQIMCIPSPAMSNAFSPHSQFLSPQLPYINPNYAAASAGEEPYWGPNQPTSGSSSSPLIGDGDVVDFAQFDSNDKFDFFPSAGNEKKTPVASFTSASVTSRHYMKTEGKSTKPSEMAHPLKKIRDAIGPDGKIRSVLFQCGYPGCERSKTNTYGN